MLEPSLFPPPSKETTAVSSLARFRVPLPARRPLPRSPVRRAGAISPLSGAPARSHRSADRGRQPPHVLARSLVVVRARGWVWFVGACGGWPVFSPLVSSGRRVRTNSEHVLVGDIRHVALPLGRGRRLLRLLLLGPLVHRPLVLGAVAQRHRRHQHQLVDDEVCEA